MKSFSARSAEASCLRQRKYSLVRRYKLSENLLGGSFGPTYRKCGKSNCHCAKGKGHCRWTVSASYQGHRRVERVPHEWVEDLEQAYLETRSFLEAAKEVMAINVELLALSRDELQQEKKYVSVRKGSKKGENE